MIFLDKIMLRLKEWIVDAQEFSAKRWGTIWVICALVAGGGLLSAFFGWGFAFFVPAWLVFVAYMLKRKYKG